MPLQTNSFRVFFDDDNTVATDHNACKSCF